jgi:hypothetical protein
LALPLGAGNDDETKQKAIVRTLVNQAINGNMRAISVVLSVMERTLDPVDEGAEHHLSEHDREILERFAQRQLGTADESEPAEKGRGSGAPAEDK